MGNARPFEYLFQASMIPLKNIINSDGDNVGNVGKFFNNHIDMGNY